MTSSPRFYVIGTKYARLQDVLPRMIMDGVISTGFVRDLDLTPIIGKGYPVAHSWVEAQIPHESGVAKNTLARFAGMKPGDVVALKAHSAPQGSQTRLVIARYAVVAGATKAIYAQSQALGHTLKVDFLDEQEPIELALGYGQTLHVIEDLDRIDLIFGHYAESARLAASVAVAIRDKATHSTEVAARGSYLMQRAHNALQNQLRELLLAHFGQSAVKQEESFVDLMVQLKHKTLLFEVKSSPSPVTCIREALGQLLQYSWRLGLHGKAVRYVVVGPVLASKEDIEYLAHIAAEASIQLIYCTPTTFSPSDA
jgi:hypothetical protein